MSSELNIATGRRIRLARKALDWSQTQLADAAGIDLRTVQRCEKGERLTTPNIEALATALGVTVGSLWENGRSENATAGAAPAASQNNLMLAALAQMTGMLADIREEQRVMREERREEQRAMREERREWRALMHEFLRRMPVQTDELETLKDELETLKAENTRLRGELSAAGAPDSSAVRKLAR